VLVAFVFALLAADPSSTCRLPERDSPAGLLLAEQRWVAALESRDVSALGCRLAPGFIDTNWRGELVTRKEMVAALSKRQPSRLVLSDLRAEVHGRFGIVRGINTQVCRDGSVIGRVRFTDVFVRTHSRWQALSAQETVIDSASR
jgi:hypothetical protein